MPVYPGAQVVDSSRLFGYEPEGRVFESPQAHHPKPDERRGVELTASLKYDYPE